MRLAILLFQRFGCFLWVVSLVVPSFGVDWGNPTGDEQEMLWLINRSRANPVEDCARMLYTDDSYVQAALQYYKVNKTQTLTKFEQYAAKPPLVMNRLLLEAARGHSLDMKINNFQGHVGSDGRNLTARISDTGYSYGALAENVYAYSYSTWYGHCGLVIDWGVSPPGHRNTTYDVNNILYSEVGIGIFWTGPSKTSLNAQAIPRVHQSPGEVRSIEQDVGPEIITIDFARPSLPETCITGVVYQDRNQDGAYNSREGLGFVPVMVQPGNYNTTTASSGGYAIAVSASGDYQVTAGGGSGIDPVTQPVTVSGQNVTVDFVIGDPSPTPTATPSATSSKTSTPTATSTASASSTPTPSMTELPTMTDTPTTTPSVTPTITETPIPTVTPTPTDTHTPTATFTPTVTPTPSFSPTPTMRPVDAEDCLGLLRDWHTSTGTHDLTGDGKIDYEDLFQLGYFWEP